MTVKTRLLVSVRNASEAGIALSAGADLIDVKEPARGPLGAPDRTVVEEVVELVAARVPVSVALGELCEPGLARRMGMPDGVRYAKLGMAGAAAYADWSVRWRRGLAQLPSSVLPVAVVYGDWARAGCPHPKHVLAEASRLGCAAVLVDTFDKSGGGLLVRWPLDELAEFTASVHRQGMLLVLGGSLSAETLDEVLPLDPHYVAVRGAVCHPDRSGSVRAERVRRLAQKIRDRDPHRFQ